MNHLARQPWETALEQDQVVTLEKIDTFVNGAAVKRAGDLTFQVCKQNLNHEILLIPEEKVCSKILQMYNEEAIVA